MMTLYLHSAIKKYLPLISFNYLMQLQGQCFRTQKNRCTQRVIIGENAYFLKQHLGVGWKEIIKNVLQAKLPICSAKNEWQAIQRLEQLGVLTPEIAAYGCKGINPARLQSFLLTKELMNVISLEDFCRDWKNNPPPFALKLALIRKVAAIARIMHANGINHRDFYICHFLLKQASDGTVRRSFVAKNAPQDDKYPPKLVAKNGPLELLCHPEQSEGSPYLAGNPSALSQDSRYDIKLYLIDLHRAGIHKKLAKRWIIKDLAGLYFSSKDIGLTSRDILRFIQAYRQKSLQDIMIHEMEFWQLVKARGDKLYAAHALST